MYEPARREGDAERTAVAQVPTVSRQHRKIFAMALAALACVAIIAVAGMGDSAQAERELLGVKGGAASAFHSRDVLQQLLADVERASSNMNGAFSPAAQRPIELEEKKTGLPSKPCNAACVQRKKEIAQRMKALKDQINHDFQSMTSVFPTSSLVPCSHLSSLPGQAVASRLALSIHYNHHPAPF